MPPRQAVSCPPTHRLTELSLLARWVGVLPPAPNLDSTRDERRPEHRRPAPQSRGREVGPRGSAAGRAPPPRPARGAAPAPGALLPRAARRGVRGDDRALRERPQDRPPDRRRDAPPARQARGD